MTAIRYMLLASITMTFGSSAVVGELDLAKGTSVWEITGNPKVFYIPEDNVTSPSQCPKLQQHHTTSLGKLLAEKMKHRKQSSI